MWQIIAPILTFLLGLGVVWKKASKYLKVAKGAGDFIIRAVKALEDQTLTPDELKDLAKMGKDILDALEGKI